MIRVQLKDSELTELHKVYRELHERYVPISPHHLLLKGHIKELSDWLNAQVRLCRKKYTIQLDGSALLAFVQLWEKNGCNPGGVYDTTGMVLTNFQARIIQLFFNKLSHLVVTKKLLQ